MLILAWLYTVAVNNMKFFYLRDDDFEIVSMEESTVLARLCILLADRLQFFLNENDYHFWWPIDIDTLISCS